MASALRVSALQLQREAGILIDDDDEGDNDRHLEEDEEEAEAEIQLEEEEAAVQSLVEDELNTRPPLTLTPLHSPKLSATSSSSAVAAYANACAACSPASPKLKFASLASCTLSTPCPTTCCHCVSELNGAACSHSASVRNGAGAVVVASTAAATFEAAAAFEAGEEVLFPAAPARTGTAACAVCCSANPTATGAAGGVSGTLCGLSLNGSTNDDDVVGGGAPIIGRASIRSDSIVWASSSPPTSPSSTAVRRHSRNSSTCWSRLQGRCLPWGSVSRSECTFTSHGTAVSR